MRLWTCNNHLNWVYTTKNWIDQPPSWVAVSVCIPIQAPAIARLIDSHLSVVCFAPVLLGMNGRNMSHSDLSLLNKPIYQVAPRSLVNVGPFITQPLFFSSPLPLYLPIQRKPSTEPAPPPQKNKKTFLIIKKEGSKWQERQRSFSSKLDNEKRVKMILLN